MITDEAADAIVLAAGSGLVCMATHGRGGPTRSLLGSVAAEVLARVTAPVIVVGPHARRWARSNGCAVVAVVEGGPARDSVAESAASFAEERRAELVLLQAHPPMPDLIAPSTDAPDSERLDAIVARLSQRPTCRGVSVRGRDVAGSGTAPRHDKYPRSLLRRPIRRLGSCTRLRIPFKVHRKTRAARPVVNPNPDRRLWIPDLGGRLATAVWGAGAPSIILLHDGLGSLAQWRGVPAMLAARTGRAVAAYERAGHGESTPVPTGGWPARWHRREAEVLERVMAHLAMSERIVVGHSDGATIGFEHAMLGHHQDMLVAIASHSFLEDVALETCRSLWANADRVAARLAASHEHPRAVVEAWCKGWMSPAMADYDLRPELGSLEHPVLIAQGELDEYATTDQAITTAAAIGPNAELHLEPGVRHLWHHDDPNGFVELVAEFVGRAASRT